MAASTKWRVIGLEAVGAAALGTLQLLKGADRVDGGATVSALYPPDTGSLGALSDNDSQTVCVFSQTKLRTASFSIIWDLPTAVDVTDLKVEGVLNAATVQSFQSGRWVTEFRWVASKTTNQLTAKAAAYWSLNASVADEIQGLVLEPVNGQPPRWAAARVAGNSCLSLSGGADASAASGLRSLGSGVGAFGLGDFEISCWVNMAAAGSSTYARILDTRVYGTPGGWSLVRVGTGANPGIRFHTSVDGNGYFERATTNGAWHLIEVRQVSRQLGLFIDGQLLVTAANNYSFFAPDFSVGCDPGGGERFAGLIDQVAVFNGWSRPLASYTLPANTAPNWVQPAKISSARDQLICAASSPLTPHTAPGPSDMVNARDTEFGGQGNYPFRVEGLAGSQKARVTLLRARDRLVAREAWSAADGTGEFTGLDTSTKFIAVAEDPSGLMHPVGAAHYPVLPGALP